MIDGGPLRISRPTGRQDAYRTEPVRHQPEEPQYSQPALPPEPPQPAQQHHRAEPVPETMAPRRTNSLGWIKWIVAVLIVAAIVAAGWAFWPKEHSIATTIDTGKYQAVFLSNGQVYFGKLSIVNSDFMQLTNVFYLERQMTANTDTNITNNEPDKQPTAANDNNFQLLKYSDVLYGSEDAMIISREDIIRYENLRPDGVVAKAIANRR